MSRDDEENRNKGYPIWDRLYSFETGYDCDLVQRPGMYALSQPLNSPIAGVDIFLTVLSANVNGTQRIVQTANETVNGRSYTRVRKDGGWSTWNWDNPSPQTEQLTANRSLYVRTDGDDNNTGLTNTAAGALKTFTKAIEKVKSYDFNKKTVTINVAAGDYSSEPVVYIDQIKNGNASTFAYSLRIIGSSFDVNTAPNYKLPEIVVRTGDPGALVELVGVTMPAVSFTNSAGLLNMCVMTGVFAAQAISDARVRLNTCKHTPTAPASCQYFVMAQGGVVDIGPNCALVGTPTYALGVLYLPTPNNTSRSEILVGATITGAAIGKQYNDFAANNARLSAYGSFNPGNPTTDSALFSNLPGDAPPSSIQTGYDMTYSGTIDGAITARDYDLLFELPSGYRIENFGARCKTGSATCQLRVAGNGASQGVAVGSTFNAAGGSLTNATNVNNKCGGRTPGFTLTVSGSPTGTDLHWEMRLKKIFDHVAS